MSEGRNPIDQARAIKAQIGLTESQAKAIATYRKELETFHLKRSAKRWGLGNERSRISGVAVNPRDQKGRSLDGIHERRLRDQRFDATLANAIETRKPIPPAKIDAMVERYHQRMLQNRARTIARTESIRACQVGANETWRQAIDTGKMDEGRVRKFWNESNDERECAVCHAIHDAVPKRGIPFNAYFENPKGKDGPIKLSPAHSSCRCWVSYRYFEAVQLLDEAA